MEAVGVRDPESVVVAFYASTDTGITTSDHYLGEVSLGFSVNTSMLVTFDCILPTDLPAGTYYVGWIIDPWNTESEADESNNTAFNQTSSLVVALGRVPSIFYVDARAHGANNGSSWADAFWYLQDALAAADSEDQIRMAAGVYTPDRKTGLARGDRQATFKLKTGVTLMGGYAGTGAPDPDARDTQVWPTVLSGDLNGDDSAGADPCTLWIDASRMDNSRHVVTAYYVDRTTVLDSVRIVGGRADEWFMGSGSQREPRGGGMYITGGGPRLRNCTFSGNWAGTDGGAIYVTEGSPELLDCTLWGNAAGSGERQGSGGAVSVANGSLALINCSLNGNCSCGSGGAVVIGPNSSLSAANCCFHANHAEVQAGAIYTLDSQAVLVNCTLADNRQDGNPDAIVHESSGSSAKRELRITNCILWNQGHEIASPGDSFITVASSDLRGGWFGVGSIDADPRFVDPNGADELPGTEDDDLRLGPDSPCIDAASTAALPRDLADLDTDGDTLEPLPLDRAGAERVVGGAVDMGAYEVQPPEELHPSE